MESTAIVTKAESFIVKSYISMETLSVPSPKNICGEFIHFLLMITSESQASACKFPA